MALQNISRSVFLIGPCSVVFGALGAFLCSQQIPKYLSTMASNEKAGVASIVYVTAPSEDTAKQLARSLIEKKLAACVNIVPKVVSVYKWEGVLTEDSEVLMMIKTRTTSIQSIVELMKTDHPYDCPEVISVPIQDGSKEYIKWVEECVTPSQ